MASGSSLESGLGEAQAAIEGVSSYQKSKWAQRLDEAGDHIQSVAGATSSPSAQLVESVSTLTLSAVKSNMSSFAENSKLLIGVLNELGKAHPFISVAVSVFNAALTLELTRRENDQKIIALNMKMCDMMSVLSLLKDLTTDAAAMKTIEGRLRQRLVDIVDSIKGCAKMCDAYQKRHTAVKFFTSMKWKDRFTDIAKQFDTHKANLQFDLQIHVAVTAADVKTTLAVVHHDVEAMMTLVFEQMRSPEERQLAALVESKGGADRVIGNDALLSEIMAQSASKTERLAKRQKDEPGLTLSGMRKEIAKDPEDLIKEDTKAFEQKFSTVLIQIEEVKHVVRRESDRVIAAVQSGPHERIVDRDLYYIWKEMGWRGSVKARHLVLAIRDHFGERTQRDAAAQAARLERIRHIVNPSHPGTSTEKMEEIASAAGDEVHEPVADDEWALSFIQVNRVQSLVEALDDDLSTWVTISELNAFTAQSPVSWSLPHWLAYWTTGVELANNWYYRLILQDLSNLDEVASKVLPANRQVVNRFISSWMLDGVDDIMCGVQDTDAYDGLDWDHHFLFGQFKEYIFEKERRMAKVLDKLKYSIDQENTLALVTGGGRPETYILPLLHLFLRRAARVVHLASTVVLHEEELNILENSVDLIRESISNRVIGLRALYKMQDLSEREQLRKFSFGMYQFVVTYEDQLSSDYWTKPTEWHIDGQEWAGETDDDEQASLAVAANDVHEPAEMKADSLEATTTQDPSSDVPREGSVAQNPFGPARILYYGAQDDAEGFGSVGAHSHLSTSEEGPEAEHSLLGHWGGEYTYGYNNVSDGLVSFNITSHDIGAGTFEGSGIDAIGHFEITGQITEEDIAFLKNYLNRAPGEELKWSYKGRFDRDTQVIAGTWGPPEDEDKVSDGDADEAAADAVDGRGINDVEVENPIETSAVDEQAAISDHHHTPSLNVGLGDSFEEALKEGSEDNVEESSEDSDDSEEGSPANTFTLQRRPITFFLFRPSDEALQQNRSRALWHWARDCILADLRTRTLSWDTLRERRDRRRRYVELTNARRGRWRLDPAEEDEFTELLKTIHPADLRNWHRLAAFVHRREVETFRIYCDGCSSPNAQPLKGARCVCLQCSAGELIQTVDLCLGCIQKPVERASDGKHHSPMHNVMLHRRPRAHRALFALQRLADERLRAYANQHDAPGDHSHDCHLCDKPIVRPAWLCIECEPETMICAPCNARIEAERPWLLERRPLAWDAGHMWMHTLVSLPGSVPPDPPVVALSVDERLDSLAAAQTQAQARFDAFADETHARMARLEALLVQLVGARELRSEQEE